jgi:hypothetical protein
MMQTFQKLVNAQAPQCFFHAKQVLSLSVLYREGMYRYRYIRQSTDRYIFGMLCLHTMPQINVDTVQVLHSIFHLCTIYQYRYIPTICTWLYRLHSIASSIFVPSTNTGTFLLSVPVCTWLYRYRRAPVRFLTFVYCMCFWTFYMYF